VEQDFWAARANQLWVADLTYVATWSGFVGAAFLIDAFSRLWSAGALGMAIWHRRGVLDGLVHHSDRGSQYRSIRSTQRLAEAGPTASLGYRGDSLHNALPRPSSASIRPS
jgi:putative transposase